MFIDTAKIKVKAGRGGNGVNSLYRDKLTLKGHPDGGDGGRGGDIIIRVSTNVHTLIDFQYRHTFKAEDANHGSGKKKKGKDGKDSILYVPAGTLVYNSDTGELVKELVNAEDEYIIAEGGAGGRGNRSHKDATRGEEGEEKNILLELKLIADVGIIGLPNAGKSTLIRCLSKARPRVAAFPFTTKSPVLGMVEYKDHSFSIIEIPGLIKDAHKGKGLGHLFLRHAERVRLFLHLLDISKPAVDEIYTDYLTLNRELGLYKKDLSNKPQIIVGNKIDIETAKENLEDLEKRIGGKIIAISAQEGIGIKELIKKIVEALDK
jgi:GTP-binding protein